MRDLFLERRRDFFILISLVIALILTVFFMFIFPKYKQVEGKEKNIQSLEADTSILEQEIEQLENEGDKINLFELRKKIPRNDDFDQFLIHLEEIEALSRSRINKVELNYKEDEEIITKSEEEIVVISEEDDEKENETTSSTESTNTDTDESESNESGPKFQNIEMHLEVASPNYASFILFLTELEKLDRIMFVSYLEFKQAPNTEWFHIESTTNFVEYEIKLQTFTYVEELEEKSVDEQDEAEDESEDKQDETEDESEDEQDEAEDESEDEQEETEDESEELEDE